ncbi:hypothetical protein CTheo_8419 [Ceratobasidium theobromae]|uniref:Tc1-like transposase DDE domain-containing protein n=1 Tax=Ceratobasidium theobromae TaxID=1582974 RepID=A0A5N5Q8M6_9AGAM|nr:hypothetical protein CTheo_8419 [Ceratobasidium theobromae]
MGYSLPTTTITLPAPAMVRYCSPVTRARIVDMINQGYSTYEAGRQVSRHPTTVGHVYARYHINHDFYNAKCKPGRPTKLTPSDAVYATRLLARGKANSIQELRNNYFPNVSAESIRRRFRSLNLHGRVCWKVPFLSPRSKGRRRAWARDIIHVPRSSWARTIFSNESPFGIFGSAGRDWVWQDSGDPFNSRYTKKRVAHDGGKIMVWGCITSSGVGRLCRIYDTLTAEQYVSILEDGLCGTLKDYKLKKKKVIFQQDNDPKHKSRMAMTWLGNLGLEQVLPWPAYSPDLNIIENLWPYLDRKVRSRQVLPKNKEELWEALQEEWYAIDPSVISNLYKSIPRRISAVVKKRGGNTGY